MAVLAINGGAKLIDEPIRNYPWPEHSDVGLAALTAVYQGTDWGFNSVAEQRFEREFAAFHDAKHAIFMANGTVTLECALAVFGVGPGDEVIVPAVTWMATALAPAYLGAIPVIVDIDPETLCMSPEAFEAAITERTRAVIPVHAYGSTCEIEKIIAIARKHKIRVIEDCAHAHGGKWAGRGVGSFGDVGSFSFQQSKLMASGEGGICITNDDKVAHDLFLLKHIGYDRDAAQGHAKDKPDERLLCHNYRSTAFQAAILSSQLATYPERMRRYEQSVRILRDAVRGLSGIRAVAPGRLSDPQSYYMFHFVFDGPEFAGIDTARLNAACAAEGVSFNAAVHAIIYNQQLFNLPAGRWRKGPGGCPEAEKIIPHKTIGFIHNMLYYPENAEKAAAVLGKVVKNIGELSR